MTLPEPTQELLKRLKHVAVLLETVAERAKTERAYATSKASAKTVWLAMDRIEDLAGMLEEIAPDVPEAE